MSYYYVYVIRSIHTQKILYIGYTMDIKNRLKTHNAGGSTYTKQNKPWELVTCTAFKDKIKALNFEKYLKSHSGRAFIAKHF